MSEQQQHWMRMALQAAHKNLKEQSGGPFGAVVVRGSELLSCERNRVLERQDPTAHAEVLAIRAACAHLGTFQLEGCELYTTCEPCPMCLGAIYWARPDRVFFASTRQEAAYAGFDDAFIYHELELPLTQRSIPMQQMLAMDSADVFEAWRQLQDKPWY